MKVDVSIGSNAVCLDRPCAFCGVTHELDVAVARVHIDGKYVGNACEHCLDAGSGVKQRIKSQAVSLRRRAQFLDRLATADIKLPSPISLETAIEESAAA